MNSELKMNQELLLQVSHVSKRYQEGSVDTEVLHDVELQVFKGEQLAIVGSSGSGKSTLLHIMGTLDRPISGSVTMLGED